MHRTYGIDNWISREYFRGKWEDAQATAFRRGELLESAKDTLEYLQDHHCSGLCPESHAPVMDKVNSVISELAKELGDG